jgi:hypothetical protein
MADVFEEDEQEETQALNISEVLMAQTRRFDTFLE